MNIAQRLAKGARCWAGVGIIAFLIAGCKPAAPATAAKPVAIAIKTNLPPVAASGASESYLSAFEDLPSSKGRDPFYPDSHRREPAPPPAAVVAAAHKTPLASDLLLKGIVGSATHRLAVINNEILEVGEESPVRVPNGQVRVRVVEIGEDYVVINVDGEARSQRLEMAKKSY
jgi:hypothetical protein